jgi:transglutaminase-like putative cysteine protease
MFYSIRHLTKFRYSSPVSESLMEVRMNPRSEGLQRCLSFSLSVAPRAQVHHYRDYLGNVIHHFDVPSPHRSLTIIAEAMVDVTPQREVPASLGADAWERLDADLAERDFWEMLTPSHFAHGSGALSEFAEELKLPSREEARALDPLELLRLLNASVYQGIEYVPKSTRVDSPAEEALKNRRGVCQDYSHIVIALVRQMGIPCRYVSGYLFHSAGVKTRSREGATHAWVEAYLPGIGWTGFDPTNNAIAGETHVRTAIGRDYADVPPTRGMFKGDAASELTVAVRVAPSDKAPPPEAEMAPEDWSEVIPVETTEESEASATVHQQQQQ